MASDVERVWSRGDYPRIATLFEPAAVDLVGALDVAGATVLDVAAGTGNAAIAALAAGAARVGLVDGCAPLLADARERLAGAGGPGHVVLGDLHRLPVRRGWASRVVSSFGVVYADDPHAAAGELARACRPGGWIGLTAFRPDAPPGCFRGVLAGLLDVPVPRRSAARPADWASADTVSGFFRGTGVEPVSVLDRTLSMRFRSATEAARLFSDKSGPILEVREHLEARNRWPEAWRVLVAAFEDAGHHDDGFVVPAPYRMVLLRRSGEPA